MPIVKTSSYPGPPFYLYNGHFQTIVPSILHSGPDLPYDRERLELEDGDFLDLDWMRGGNDKLAILSHGLEGNSRRGYILRTANQFFEAGWDTLAWNCRSCSGELNRNLQLYHHGDIIDIGYVIRHALEKHSYKSVVLLGFSMGGNIILNYLGRNGVAIPSEVKGGIAFSTPCDLETSSKALDNYENRFYKNKFLKALRVKIELKSRQFPGKINLNRFSEIKTWRDFDEWYSAPLCGYSGADEFYYYSSAKNHFHGIKVPTLVVNAANDPILTPESSPTELCADLPYVFLETPSSGGHVGFPLKKSNLCWTGMRAIEFYNKHINKHNGTAQPNRQCR